MHLFLPFDDVCLRLLKSPTKQFNQTLRVYLELWLMEAAFSLLNLCLRQSCYNLHEIHKGSFKVTWSRHPAGLVCEMWMRRGPWLPCHLKQHTGWPVGLVKIGAVFQLWTQMGAIFSELIQAYVRPREPVGSMNKSPLGVLMGLTSQGPSHFGPAWVYNLGVFDVWIQLGLSDRKFEAQPSLARIMNSRNLAIIFPNNFGKANTNDKSPVWPSMLTTWPGQA